MSAFDFDLFTLGAGSGGVAASRLAASYGARVGICEESRVGGTCVMRGCVPKKLLVMGTHYGESLADARGFGWTFERATLDWKALVRAKEHELDRLEGIYRRLLDDRGVTLFAGHGRLLDAHTVDVSGRAVTADKILIATGGRPFVPPIPGIELAITSNEALSLPSLPSRVLILGGGYIGCEFAGIFRAAGVEVTMLIRGQELLRGFDDDIRSALTLAYRNKGIRIVSDVVVRDIQERPDGRRSVLSAHGETFEADVVLAATGRTPNTGSLGLDRLALKLDSSGAVTVDEQSRTNVPNIYAVGDSTNRKNLTPVAIAEGRTLVEMLFHGGDGIFDHRLVPSAVFSQPPVATVGDGEAEARQHGEPIDVYATSFLPMRHTISGRKERTMMKLVVDRKSERVLGLHMVGDEAPEIVQGFAVALRCGATKTDFDKTVGIHPTAAEEFVTMREKRPVPTPE